MITWDGKLPSHCGVCGKHIRIEFNRLAEYRGSATEPICSDCSDLREQIAKSSQGSKETI